jgi:hypothetical protein
VGNGHSAVPTTALVPDRDDLPGTGWRSVELGGSAGAPAGDGPLDDCVGDDFPGSDELVDSASSAHFVRRRQLVHGIAVRFTTAPGARRAAACLRRDGFAECLGRSLAGDLGADDAGPELVEVRVAEGGPPHRVSFTAAAGGEVLTVHLDIVVLVADRVVSLVWFGDGPTPFPPDERAHVVDRLASRLGLTER